MTTQLHRRVLALLMMAGVWIFVQAPLPSRAQDGGLTVSFLDSPGPWMGSLVIAGISDEWLDILRARDLTTDQWHEIFTVHVSDSVPPADLPAVLGDYHVGGDVLLFKSRFGLMEGLGYFVHVDFTPLEGIPGENVSSPTPFLETVFMLDVPEVEATTIVTAVYPSATELPANQLKFYIHFSAPMRDRPDIYHHIRLVYEDGGDVARPFLEMEPLLWDPSRQRLTLFFHPGRIKRGLAYSDAAGPPMEAGNTYTLVIDAGMTDAAGNPLVADFEKTFTTRADDRTSPDYKAWHIEVPAVASREPVRIYFDEALDHALLGRFIGVKPMTADHLDGYVTVLDDETAIEFVPAEPWVAGDYMIVVASNIEDLAGNQLFRLFDAETSGRPVASHEREVFIRFKVER